jgi:transposase
VASLDGRLEFHRLPTYAPDLNPDEFVWSHMKTNGVSKKPLKQNKSLRQRVEEDLVKIQDNPLVRSFFGAKTVAYAAD